jgi:hypothetical protein
MSQTVFETTARCLAFAADGTRYEIVEVTKFTILAARPSAGRQYQKIACSAKLRTVCGMGAERRSKGRYFIPQSAVEVVSDNPNAP